MSSRQREMIQRLKDAAVIVVSILIAFALDAWWDSRQTREESAKLLEGILSEVQFLATTLSEPQGENPIAASADTIVRQLRSTEGPVMVPVRTLSYLFRTPTTDRPSSALSVWIASGRASLVPDPRLRELLTALPARIADAREEEDLAAEFVRETLIPEFSGIVDLGPVMYARWDPDARDSISVPNSQKVISLIETRGFLAAFVVRQQGPLRRTIEEILGIMAE